MATYSEFVIDDVIGDIHDKDAVHYDELKTVILDYIYPVGRIVISASSSFDPNTEWGGEWQKIDQGKVLLSSGTNYAVGSTGGEKSHTLTADQCALPGHTHTYNKPKSATNNHTLSVAQIPSHNHGSKSLVGYFNVRRWVSDGHIVTGSSGIVSQKISGSKANSTASYGTSAQPGLDIVTVDATHTHTSQGGGQGHSHGIGTDSTNTSNTSKSATKALSLMQPYMAVDIWQRIA